MADCTRANNLVLKRGNACIYLRDTKGNICKCLLKRALYIPKFKQNIFSVQSAVKVNFYRDNSKLIYPGGTEFNIQQNGRLYYLKSIKSVKTATHDLRTWHKILGHCNNSDVRRMYLSDISPYGKVKIIRTDNGGEFTSDDYENLLINEGIKHEKTCSYSLHQNGIAERSWRTLFKMTRCLLIEPKLPKNLCVYALNISIYKKPLL